MPERGHAQRDHVRASPEVVAIEKPIGRRVLHRRIGAGDRVARPLELLKGIPRPGPLGGPVGHGRGDRPLLLHLPVDRGVEGDFHLVDGDAIGPQPHRPAHAFAPTRLGIVEHSGDQVDVDLLEADRSGVSVGPVDLAGEMCPAVGPQNLVVEMLDPQAQPGDPQFVDCLQLLSVERARLAFKGHLLGLVPGQEAFHSGHELPESRRREKRGRAAAEIDEPRPPPGQERSPGVHREFAQQGLDIARHAVRLGIAARIDAEVAEVAPLAAERQVDVDAQRDARPGCLLQRRQDLSAILRLPEREGRIVGNEVVAHRRFLPAGCRDFHFRGHHVRVIPCPNWFGWIAPARAPRRRSTGDRSVPRSDRGGENPPHPPAVD